MSVIVKDVTPTFYLRLNDHDNRFTLKSVPDPVAADKKVLFPNHVVSFRSDTHHVRIDHIDICGSRLQVFKRISESPERNSVALGYRLIPSGYWRTAVAVVQSMPACAQTGCLTQQSPNVTTVQATPCRRQMSLHGPVA
jgi:hypothetical protein